jgi:hypothetical protein
MSITAGSNLPLLLRVERILNTALQQSATAEVAALKVVHNIVSCLDGQQSLAPSTLATIAAAVAQIEDEVASECLCGECPIWDTAESLGLEMLLDAIFAFGFEVEAREQGLGFEIDEHGRDWLQYEDGVHDVWALCIPCEGESAQDCVSRIGAALRMGCPHCAAAQAAHSLH